MYGTLIVGEIIWTTLSGFFVVIEFIIHMLAFQALGSRLRTFYPIEFLNFDFSTV